MSYKEGRGWNQKSDNPGGVQTQTIYKVTTRRESVLYIVPSCEGASYEMKTAKASIPTPSELRNRLRGSDRFSALDMRDSFFQSPMDKDSSRLYTFWTTKGLYKFNTLAQGVSSASAKTYDWIRQIMEGVI